MAPKTHPNDDPTIDTVSPPLDATDGASAPVAEETSTASTS